MSDDTTGIDPRGPRFGAGITGVLLLTVIALALAGASLAATLLFGYIVAVFAWGAFAGIRRHPYGLFFKRVIRPRLKPPLELENAAPPTFSQGVGLVITGLGLVLHLVGVPYALVIAASLAFIAAFLNSVFAYCMGCQIYLLLARAKVIRTT
ncbi:MAG: DUF4395 domain-containing protein [Pseudolysinimonas sp.]